MAHKVKVYGLAGPHDYYDLKLSPSEWYELRDGYVNRKNRVVAITDLDADELYFDIEKISSLLKYSKGMV